MSYGQACYRVDSAEEVRRAVRELDDDNAVGAAFFHIHGGGIIARFPIGDLTGIMRRARELFPRDNKSDPIAIRGAQQFT